MYVYYFFLTYGWVYKKKILEGAKNDVCTKCSVQKSYREENGIILVHISKVIERVLYQMKAHEKRNLGV
jgi:hypothetical protein